jgi:hypothetical protein
VTVRIAFSASVNKQPYLEEAIRTGGLWDSAPQLTPMGTERLEPAGEDYNALPLFKAEYQSYVGTLMYAMLGTRPDIAFSVACVSRYASNPTPAHMKLSNESFHTFAAHSISDLRFEGISPTLAAIRTQIREGIRLLFAQPLASSSISAAVL